MCECKFTYVTSKLRTGAYYLCDRRALPEAGPRRRHAGDLRQRMLPEAGPRRRDAGELCQRVLQEAGPRRRNARD